MELSDSVLLIGVAITYAICFALSFYYQQKDAEIHEKKFWFLILMSLTPFFIIWVISGLLFLLIRFVIGIEF